MKNYAEELKTESNIMNNPLVSIIITCYNYGKFVKDAIDSAINQTYKPIEIVIVNDGSTDNSDDIIKSYLQNPNIVYVTQSNTGLSIARNNGIEKSTGEIIVCLDADDYFSPEYIENIVKNFTDYKTIVSTDVYHTDEFLNLLGHVWPTSPTTYTDLLTNNYVCVSSGFSRKLFDEVGGYDSKMNRMGCEDWDLWIRMHKAGANVVVINSLDNTNPYYRYRKHGYSMIDDSIKNRKNIDSYLHKKYVAQNFYMEPTYKINEIAYFDDTSLKDEWQNEVYLYAKNVIEQNNYKTVVDFGCGSGYKLIKYFNEYNTIGIDLPPTVSVLRKRYPDKSWRDNLEPVDCDVFIAADVIEHMENPNILLDFIKKCNPKEIILSTPDRNLRIPIVSNGPPENIYHIREWSVGEFRNYIESQFDIVKHSITNKEQCTQMIHSQIKNKEVAHLFWHGELTNLEKTCIQSFVKQGFDTKIWSYTNIQVDGAESCDARLVLPEEHLTKYKYQHYSSNGSTDIASMAAFSDAFRYNVISKFGGWWFDTDCYCLKPATEFEKLRRNKPFVAGIESYDQPVVNSAVFYANANSSTLLVNRLNELCEQNNYSFNTWGTIGPMLISDVVQDNNLTNYILDPEYFYSINYTQIEYFIEPTLLKEANVLIGNSYVTHIWHSKLMINLEDINNPPANTLLSELYSGNYQNFENNEATFISKYKQSLSRYINVSNLYKKVLNRPGDIEGIKHYVESMLPYDRIEQIFLDSEEYKNLLKGT